MTNDFDIINLIRRELDSRQLFNQMNPSPIPNHTHNGTDSSRISGADVIGSLGGQVLLTTAEVSSTSSFIIENLQGDSYGFFHLVIRAEFNADENAFNFQFNNDGGAVYDTDAATGQTEINLSGTTARSFWIDMLICTKTGVRRIMNWKVASYKSGATAAANVHMATWNNTTDNITSLDFAASQNFLAGTTYWIYGLN